LAGALTLEGIPVEGQAIYYLLVHAALAGVICFGPDREGKQTYVSLEDWITLDRPLDPDRALAELAHRYLEAYGPATPADLAKWAGVSIPMARSGFESIADELYEIEVAGSPAWMLTQHTAWLADLPGEPVIRLLPGYDLYILGYDSRDFMVSEQYARRIHPGGGLIKPCLIVEGQAVGIWRYRRDKQTIVVDPFETIDADIMPYLEAEVQDVGHFLKQDITLHLETP
jgi:hypothetical protein